MLRMVNGDLKTKFIVIYVKTKVWGRKWNLLKIRDYISLKMIFYKKSQTATLENSSKLV